MIGSGCVVHDASGAARPRPAPAASTARPGGMRSRVGPADGAGNPVEVIALFNTVLLRLAVAGVANQE